ncbi:MAG: putative colanic acid biosynthesis UDP-glucose lipid carrier transferase [Urechidicola sp.]|jgi:putative colanic acid biosynthesis UDP-glucose lipid carrier transferase
MKNRFYTRLVKPVLFLIDLLIICLFTYYFLTQDTNKIIVISLFWIILAVFLSIKNAHRTIVIIKVVSVTQMVRILLFLLLVLSYFYVVNFRIENQGVLIFGMVTYMAISILRILINILIRKYAHYKDVYFDDVVIIGFNDSTKKLENFFINNKGHNYRYKGFFTNKQIENRLGGIEQSFKYIIDNNIDEIYCSVKELSDNQMNEIVFFADNNVKTLKLIPNNKHVFSKKLVFENYDLIPILSLSNIPLKEGLNIVVKRTFDIVFSLMVIIGFLSWFTPLIALFIKLESKGDVFFKQLRYGADFNLFACYKFRSMRANRDSDSVQASKNDMRVTRIGRFIRKTSIDELPQFYNVLFGSMSVVGPRPLLLSHTNDYKNKIEKFMVRHTVKPGITGLAQVSGYRGIIEKETDMQNRVKYDIFYIENWSLFLDIKIIIKTILNILRGEENAY